MKKQIVLGLEERMKIFIEEVRKVEEKTQVTLLPVLQVNEQGIKPILKLVEIKPDGNNEAKKSS